MVLDVAYSHHIHSFSLNTICQFLKWGRSCCLPSLEYWRAWIYREMLESQTIKVMIFRTMKSPYFWNDNRNLTVELRVLEINKPDNFSDHALTKNLGAQIICEISSQRAHQNFCKSFRKVSVQVSYCFMLSIMRYNLNDLFLPLQWCVSQRHTADTSKHLNSQSITCSYFTAFH